MREEKFEIIPQINKLDRFKIQNYVELALAREIEKDGD